jgi:hypothetical protein
MSSLIASSKAFLEIKFLPFCSWNKWLILHDSFYCIKMVNLNLFRFYFLI